MNPLLAAIASSLVLASIGCTAPLPPLPTLTPVPVRATVTDLSVPFTSSEADALVARGFLGEGAYGRLGIGCTVEVLKTTERAAQVRPVSCPQDANTSVPRSAIGPSGLPGWVAKSALDLKP